LDALWVGQVVFARFKVSGMPAWSRAFSDVVMMIWRLYHPGLCALGRLRTGRAEQWLVGGAEVGGRQAIWVKLSDLFGYGEAISTCWRRLAA
jgi:hypothetical protein